MEARSFTIPSCSLLFFALTVLLLISNINPTLAGTSTTAKSNSLKIYKNFIKTSCNSTLYPALCYKYLSSHASTIKTDSVKLCNTALTVNLKAANKTSALVTSMAKKGGLRPSEKAVIEDCNEEIDDCVDELRKASNVLDNLRDALNKEDQMADIKTWVSAAMTDEDTCMDEFEENNVRESVKNKIKKSIVDLRQITSNSLALINRLSN
ncbi:PMEI domain-containing protein [Citrus sinensis]|uniref:PMEI domain-containing protein n=1 Tax=Citrus sinensis TaxID=2711 RepID=A0ACB8HVN6_CITSI|nr:PMEI domain-containing protein [Citrus sinensis]